MSLAKYIIGIDISKEKFDCLLIAPDQKQSHKVFNNTEAGFKGLQKWLKKQGVQELHACMEATNIYWEELALYLHQQGYQVSVVNPKRIKGFAQSQLRRSKTDKIDSTVIALFCQQTEPHLWQPPAPEQRHLQILHRHHHGLKKSLTQQKNRLSVARDEIVRTSLLAVIQTLEEQMALIEGQMQALIEQHPHLKQQQALLMTINGIGLKTATGLMAEMYDLAHYDHARAAAADAGLTPSHHQSGSSVKKRPRLSKEGKASVRGLLYWPAISAMQHNPIIRAFAQKLLAQGKLKKVVIAAAMRKLLHLAYGVLKHQHPFDPDYGNKSSAPSRPSLPAAP